MGDDIIQEPAPGDAACAEVKITRLLGRAARHGLGTAGMEGASCGQVGQIGRLARDRIQGILAAEPRHRAEQGSRVWVRGVVYLLPIWRLLYDIDRCDEA